MKSIFVALVFIVSGFAYADQQAEIVEFEAIQGVATCVDDPQQGVSCQVNSEITYAAVTIVKSTEHQGVMVGHLYLQQQSNMFNHDSKVIVVKENANQSDAYYSFYVYDFYKSPTLPSGTHAYGEVYVDVASHLNTVSFYNEGEIIENRYYYPFVMIAPLTADGKIMRAQVLKKVTNDVTRKIKKQRIARPN